MGLAGALISRVPPRIVEGRRAAMAIHETVYFGVRETKMLARRGEAAPAAYTTRAGGLTIHVRHGSRDVAILGEVFGQQGYRPPAEVERRVGSRPHIIDAGGNIGLFGAYAAHRWPRARITSYEPDPDNFELLRRTVTANDLGPRWSLVEAAVSNHAGQLDFITGLYSEAHVAAAGEPDAVRVRAADLFATRGDLLKLDIEGGEWAILTDPRLAELDADVLVLEWHHRHAPVPDPGTAAASLLRHAGYTEIRQGTEYRSTGTLWAWRPR